MSGPGSGRVPVHQARQRRATSAAAATGKARGVRDGHPAEHDHVERRTTRGDREHRGRGAGRAPGDQRDTARAAGGPLPAVQPDRGALAEVAEGVADQLGQPAATGRQRRHRGEQPPGQRGAVRGRVRRQPGQPHRVGEPGRGVAGQPPQQLADRVQQVSRSHAAECGEAAVAAVPDRATTRSSFPARVLSVPPATVPAMEMRLELVAVPVSDVDRAKAFYVDQVGFVADHDHQVHEGLRFVQLTPPGSACSLVLGIGITDMPPGSQRGLQCVIPDADAARVELAGRGVEVSEVEEQPWGRFVHFADPDGNTWALQQIVPPA